MSIDWFTVIAQTVNFIILVWLMKRFLYKPILNAIDTREKRIAAELADADAKKAEAKTEHDAFQKKNEYFDRHHDELLNKAKAEVKAERERLLNEVQKEAENLSAKRQEVLRNDAHNLNESISLRTRQEVFAIARKTLTDLGEASLEERMSDVFIRRLRELDDKAKAVISETLKTANEPALLRTAFDLSVEDRVNIQNAINETFEAEILMRFVTEPNLISGIEFTINGYKIAWNISDYLESMDKGIDELLKIKDKPGVKNKAHAIVATPEKRSK